MPGGLNLKMKRAFVGSEQQQFAEEIIMVVDANGKGCMVRDLLDTGCSKSIILKEFTKKKQRNRLKWRDKVQYQIYGCVFSSNSKESVGFNLIEFKEQRNQTVEYKFQVDKEHWSDNMQHIMIIGNNMLWNMGLDI